LTPHLTNHTTSARTPTSTIITYYLTRCTFFFSCYGHHPPLHSFPTRRSSDLIPAHGVRRITFTPRPAGLRFYHTHNRAGADLHAGQYSAQVGAVYIEAEDEPGRHDREVFLMLKEFQGAFSQGGDMPQDFLSPATKVKEL